MRTLLAVGIAVLAPVAVAHAKSALNADQWLCLIGQFQSADGGATVEVADGNIAYGDTCPMTPAKLKQTKKRTVLSAKWAGCQGLKGPIRVTVTVTDGSCNAADVRVHAPKAKVSHRFKAVRSKGLASDCQSDDTYAQIERRVLGPHGCRVETCHGSAKSGGLDLRLGVADENLVGVPAVGSAGMLRVAPGDAAKSFLVRKLAGVLGPGEGDQMPSVGQPISPLELDLVRAWVDAGAPETGTVPNAPCPPPHRFEPAKPIAPPPGGYQILYEGPTLQPGQEIEGCEWVEVPNAQDFVVGEWEYSLNPGTHHLALWEHRPEAAMPPLHEFRKDTACIEGGARFGLSLSGAPEAPYYVDKYPGNVAKVVKGGSILGINPHYFNEFDVPIQIKFWVNLYPAPPNAIIADSLLSLTGALNGKSTFSIFVPPGQVASLRLRYTNDTAKTWTIPQVSSHEHQRGIHFAAWRSDGAPLYDNSDWAHPRILDLAPPLTIAPGDYIEYECTHDNGVSRNVRRCGDSPHDVGCTPGDPVPVTFGVTAQDEMCFLTGLVY